MSLTIADFALHSVQIVGFAATQDFRVHDIRRVVEDTWSDVYDGELVSLPVPPDAPRVVPLVVMSRRDDSERIQVARERLDIHKIRGQDEGPLDLSAALDELSGRLAHIVAATQLPPERLGAVLERRMEMDSPAQAVAAHFCQERWLAGPLAGLEAFEAHAYKKLELFPGLTVNSWTRVRTQKQAGGEYRYVTVGQDINTLMEEQEGREFGREGVLEFFRSTVSQFDELFHSYFPLQDTE